MGAIIDTLYLAVEEISVIEAMYPDCKVINQSHSGCGIQKYRVIIPNEENCHDAYYTFLIDHGIAMSSSSFVGRIASDQRFVNRMRQRIAEFDGKVKKSDIGEVHLEQSLPIHSK